MIRNLLAVAASSNEGTFWLPPGASTVSGDIDFTFYFIYWLSVLFFILVMGTLGYLAVKYRRRDGKIGPTHPLEGNIKLEIIWSAIPTVLLLIIFAMGFQGFIKLAVAPGNSMDVNVTAQTWSWGFEYPGLAGTSSDLIVPANRPVKLTMSSQDVLHSLFVPAFRVKQDVLPNRYTSLWFEATDTGRYDLYCTEYCGTGHSMMVSPAHNVRVLSEADYDKWVANGGPYGEVAGKVDTGELTPAQAGKLLFNKVYGCAQCHSLGAQSDMKVGPGLGNLAGNYEGTSLPNNNASLLDYLQESIENPAAYIAQPNNGQMPSFQGRISMKEIGWIYEFLKNDPKSVK